MYNYKLKTFYVYRLDDVEKTRQNIVYGHYVIVNETSFIIYKQCNEPNGMSDIAVACYPLSHYYYSSRIANISDD
jgi:hypothetical protein